MKHPNTAVAGMNAAGLRKDERWEQLRLFGLASPALLIVLVILVIPVGWLFFVSFIGADGTLSMENYESMVKANPTRAFFTPPSRSAFVADALTIAGLVAFPQIVLYLRRSLLG